MLTGASPDTGSLKELGQDVAPIHGTATIVDNQLWFLSPTGHGLVVATPSFVESETLRHLSPLAYPGSNLDRPNNSFMPQSAVGDDINGNLMLPGRLTGDDDEIVAVERDAKRLRKLLEEHAIREPQRRDLTERHVDSLIDRELIEEHATTDDQAEPSDSNP